MNRVLVVVCALLGIALIPSMPYGYYVFLRIAVFGFCSWWAFVQFAKRPMCWGGIACALLAVLYNPIWRVHLTREIWTWLNVGTIVVLVLIWLISFINKRRDKKMMDAKDAFIAYATRNLPKEPSQETEDERILGERFREEMKVKEAAILSKRRERMRQEQEKLDSQRLFNHAEDSNASINVGYREGGGLYDYLDQQMGRSPGTSLLLIKERANEGVERKMIKNNKKSSSN